MFRHLIRWLPILFPIAMKFWQSRKARKTGAAGTAPTTGR